MDLNATCIPPVTPVYIFNLDPFPECYTFISNCLIPSPFKCSIVNANVQMSRYPKPISYIHPYLSSFDILSILINGNCHFSVVPFQSSLNLLIYSGPPNSLMSLVDSNGKVFQKSPWFCEI